MAAPAAMAARIIRTDKNIVADLQAAGALSAETAIRLAGDGLRGRRIRRLSGAGALHSASDDRYYLDEQGWTAFDHARRTRMKVALVFVFSLLALASLIGFVTFK